LNHLKKIFAVALILFTAILASCETSFGEKYTIGNLEIYYTPPGVSEKYVERLGAYFQANNLIQPNPHSVQLTSDPFSFVLKMVLDDQYKELPASQNHNLKLLEEDIKRVVFDDLNFRIEICNSNFVPLNPIQQPQ
jgi:hypothetical protein